MTGGCIDVLTTVKNKGGGGDDKYTGAPNGVKHKKVLRWILIGLGIFGFSIIVIAFFSSIIMTNKRDKSISSKSLMSVAFNAGQSIHIEHGDNFGYTSDHLISQLPSEQYLENPDEKNKKEISSQSFVLNTEVQKKIETASNAKAALLLRIQRDLEDALSAQLEQIKKNKERIFELETKNVLLEKTNNPNTQEKLNSVMSTHQEQMKKNDSHVFELEEQIKKNKERLSELEEANALLVKKNNKALDYMNEIANNLKNTNISIRNARKARGISSPLASESEGLSDDELSGDDSSHDDSNDNWLRRIKL